MPLIRKVNVVPNIPEKLKPIIKIAYNLWWVWNQDAIELFRRLDLDLWRDSGHNPVKMLGMLPQHILDEAAESDSFLSHLALVGAEFNRQMSMKTWYEETSHEYADASVAYFSAEFGIHECLPVYSGGLGILAGDHLKSASELGIPLCGVGLLYRLGYFHQYLGMDGWQQERFPEIDFFNVPIKLVPGKDNQPIIIEVPYPKGMVYAQIWHVMVGRIDLYLLDTNVKQNAPDDRSITDQLYGGDNIMRIKQEIMLGIGGVRALRALGKDCTVFHMNEGHAAFLTIERIALTMQENKMTFNEAHEFVTSSSVFTTHTPVPAGNDRFDPELIDEYLSSYYKRLGITRDSFLALGRENPADKSELFCMTVLALKTACAANGVSKLHGSVSRNMWKALWPALPEHEIPIGHVTNGIHTLSWTSLEMMRLLNRYLGPRWIDNPTNTDVWKNIDSIPDTELWRTRERSRERLVEFARKKLKKQLLARGFTSKEAEKSDSVLDSESLTIGFARRFAAYKRANLIVSDMSRLEAILTDKERPVQIIFAGKAHPKDAMGKELVKQIIALCADERFRNRIVFLEDYDINLAKVMVQGVDVWLNNPVRPKEASGTSGMKVVPNGALNISILDGWWDEAYNRENGWAIGNGEIYEDYGYQNEVEGLYLYNLLEKEVKPLFYDRGVDGIPKGWLHKIRESMKTLSPVFNTNRMVKDYTEKYYLRAHKNFRKLSDSGFAASKKLAAWKEMVISKWDSVSIKEMFCDDNVDEIAVGSKITVKVIIDLGSLTVDDAVPELYFGNINQNNEISEGASLPMTFSEKTHNGFYLYTGQVLCLQSGQFGFTVRLMPHNIESVRKFDPELSAVWINS
ncbi:MAG: alpha-glucan family phosphorylase [Spirochaetia bacterium]|jgi:starch phosphorylase|nr:alpha-glucan family phosphorylase [Spirochaetia bacterium]